MILFSVLVCCGTAAAQTAEANLLTYKAYVDGQDYDKAVDLWKSAIKRSEQQLNGDPENATLRYKLVLAQFGLLAATVREKDKDLFDEYADVVVESLERLIGEDENQAESYAVLSSVYGLMLTYSPWKGMFLGPKSSALMEKALKINPNSALVQKLYGNSKFFTPEFFGGDVHAAITAYEQAIVFYEQHNDVRDNWFYLDTFAFLGQAYLKSGNREKAIAAYEKALSVEPEYAWVKYVLLPEARKRQ